MTDESQLRADARRLLQKVERWLKEHPRPEGAIERGDLGEMENAAGNLRATLYETTQ